VDIEHVVRDERLEPESQRMRARLMSGTTLTFRHGVVSGLVGSLLLVLALELLGSDGSSVWPPFALLSFASFAYFAVAVPLLTRLASGRAAASEAPDDQRQVVGSVIESITHGVMVSDRSGRVQLLNATAREILGIARRSKNENVSVLDALAILERLDDAPREELAARFRDIVELGESFTTEIELGTPPKQYAMYLGPLRNDDDAVLGIVAVLSDITEHRAMDQMKTELMSMVTHEIRTPLSTVRGFAQILRRKGLSEEKSQEFLEIISRQSNRVVNLVNDFLDITRIETRRHPMTKAPLDLVEVIRSAVADLAPLAEEKRIELRFDPPLSELPPALGDRSLLEQVLINLISNAIKYSPQGASAQVEIQRDDAYLAVSVRDNGLGVPRESLPRLFEKFYRVRCEDRKDVIGTGLGLALVKQIVEVHGGTVHVASEHGLGSTFTFTVPAVASWPGHHELVSSALARPESQPAVHAAPEAGMGTETGSVARAAADTQPKEAVSA
jgi:two-component system phosphate regulon sensor histidine kinase PhoR